MVQLYGISNIFTAITSSGIALLIYLKGYRNLLSRIWSIFAVCVAIYGLGAYMAATATNYDSAFSWWQFSYVGVIMLPALFLHFVYVFLNIKRTVFVKIVYLLTFAILATDIFTKSLFVGNVSLLFVDSKLFKPAWWIYPPGPIHIFYTLFFYVGLLTYAHIKLIKAYKTSNPLKRTQIKYFFIATTLGFVGGGTSYLPCFGINAYPILNVTVPLYPLIMTYAIIRHQLMDIEVVIKKTLIFASLFAIVLGIFVGITLLTQELIAGGRLLGLAISSIIIIFAVRPLEDFLVRVTDKYLFQKKYDYRQVLKSFIDEVITVLDLDTVIQKTLELLDKMFHPESSVILLLDTDENRYITYGKSGYGKGIVLERTSKIPLHLKSSKNILSTEDKNFTGTNEELKNEMDNLNASLAMPLMFHDELIGIMLLGKKKSDEIYTKEDLDILTDLAQTEATVVSNSRTHTLLLQAKEKEQQAEHLVSLGFVVTNISHELRNPIHIISGAAETTLDAIDAELDINKLDEKNQKTIEYIKTKLTSIMEKSDKTHEMLESILHAVKINPENFVDLNLQKTANEAISRLESYLKSAGINIANNIPGTFPLIKADPITIEQVFVNLLTNAIHAIEYSKKGNKIQIAAYDLGDNVRMEISDDGPGIPEQDIKRIFEPFYTTKDNLYVYKRGKSKGVGLGLMIVYQTIVKHNGAISVKSKEGKGTTFVIELPKTIKE